MSTSSSTILARAHQQDTLFATADGKVKFGRRKGRKLVDILTTDILTVDSSISS